MSKIMGNRFKSVSGVFFLTLLAVSWSENTPTIRFLPESYKLKIITSKENFDAGETDKHTFYSGEVTIIGTKEVKEGFNEDFRIILNTNNKTIESELKVEVKGKEDNPEFNSTTCKFEKVVNSQLNIICKKEDHKFKQFQLDIKFKNPFGTDMTGFYRSSYKEGQDTRWLLTTHFEPIFARNAFPCFDQPDLKAIFQVDIVVPKTIETVLSNTPCKKTSNGQDLQTFKCKETVKMSTYLVAFTASNLKGTNPTNFESAFENTQTKKTLITYGRNSIINNGEFAQKVGKSALEALTKYLGIGYALDKVDQVGIPDFSAGAMENWGHISFREKSLFVNDKSTTATKQANLLTITHELVHQWFGNLVTLKSWEYIWLNEAFANYLEYIIASNFTDPKASDWQLMNQLVVNEIHLRAFETDGLTSAKALNSKISDDSQIYSAFNDIPYSKGTAVLRMWHFALKEKFIESLQKYLKDNKWGSVAPEHLFKALNSTVKMDENFFKTWTDHPGYPVVQVKKGKNDEYTVTQKRFLWEKASITETQTPWYIPITYVTDNSSSKDALTLNKEPLSFNASGKWIIVNRQQEGYYRVNYEKDNWNALKDVLKTNHTLIDEINRAQIINDVYSLARSVQDKYVDYATALDITKYLEKETSFIAWKTALNAFDFFQSKPAQPKVYTEYRSYLLKLMKPHLKPLKSDKLDHIGNLMNVELSRRACALNYEPCVKEAAELFKDDKYSSYPDTQEIILCTAVRTLNDSLGWDKVYEKYKTEEDSALKLMYISALGCSNSTTKIEELLNKTLVGSPEIRKQDSSFILSSVYNGNVKNVPIAFKFVENNFEKIAKNYGGINPVGKAIVGIARKLNTKEDIERFKKLVKEIEKSEAGKPAKESLDDALKIVETNLNWMEQKMGQFTNYFNSGSFLTYSLTLLLLALFTLFNI